MKGYMQNGTYFRDDNLGHRIWSFYDQDTCIDISNGGVAEDFVPNRVSNRFLTSEEYFELSMTIVKPWRKKMCLGQEIIDTDVANYLHTKDEKMINI